MDLDIDKIASGLVGLLLFGAMVKKFLDGYAEARKNSNSTPGAVATGFGIMWDRNQIEKVMLLFERMALGQERMAKALEELSSQQTQDMQEQLDFLVERAESALNVRSTRRPQRRPKKKA